MKVTVGKAVYGQPGVELPRAVSDPRHHVRRGRGVNPYDLRNITDCLLAAIVKGDWREVAAQVIRLDQYTKGIRKYVESKFSEEVD